MTASRLAARRIVWPVGAQLVQDFPDNFIEISTHGRLSDLAEDRFDYAIRLGGHLGPDMIAVSVAPPELDEDLVSGRLVRVMADCCPPFDGYFLCSSGRRNVSLALRLWIDRPRVRT